MGGVRPLGFRVSFHLFFILRSVFFLISPFFFACVSYHVFCVFVFSGRAAGRVTRATVGRDTNQSFRAL